MHHPIEIRIPLIDMELEIYGALGSSVDDLDVLHHVAVEAVEVLAGGYEAVASLVG
jgi:hypothetical protein